MTIAEAIKHIFRFEHGNIVAQFDFHIDQTLVLRGDHLSRVVQQLGCFWEGDRCLFMDDSFLDFDLEFTCGVE